MAASSDNTLYYQIVIDAQSAVTGLRELGEQGTQLEGVLQKAQQDIDALAQKYNVDASEIASIFKRMNADLSASERERIQASGQAEEQIAADLEAEIQKRIALNAVIAQAARDVRTGAVAPAPSAGAFAAQGEDVSASVKSLESLVAAGGELDAVEKVARADMLALAEQYNVSAPIMADAMQKALTDIHTAEVERIQSTLTGEDNIRVALAQEAQTYESLKTIITEVGASTELQGLSLAANEFMTQLKTEGLTFQETMAAMKVEVKALMTEFGVDAPTAIAALRGVKGATEEESLALQQVGRDMQEADRTANGFGSTLKMIEGVIISMAVFQGVQFLAQLFSDAIKNATDYYQALQNITVAQTALAQQGIPVTNQQLLDVVDQLHQKWQTISQTDITQAVSQAGLMASEYHLSVEQMTQLANEAAILHQLDPSKPMAEYVVQLAKALEGGRSLALNGEQIAITTEQLKNKAVELRLVQAGSTAALTDQQKVVAGLAIEYDRLHPEEAKLTDEIKNGTSSLVESEKATAQWKDMLTAIGEPIKNSLDTLKVIGVQIAAIIIQADNWWNRTSTTFGVLVATVPVVQQIAGFVYAIAQLMEGNVHSAQDFVKALSDGQTVLAEMIAKLGESRNIPTGPLSQSASRSGLDFSNTSVGAAPSQDNLAPTPDQNKLQSILDSVAKDYQSYYDGVAKATEDFDTKMQNMQDQYNLNVQKEIQNTNLRISEERQNYRLKELQQEQDFQQKMKDLTARYLLDLEDALRKRDAEAVIKIIEKYNMEKTAAEQGEAVKRQQDAEAERLKISQMKEEEKVRLEQMKEEFDLQKTEAQRAYANQLSDLQRSLDTKLQEEAVKASQDLNLNKGSIDSIYSLFQEYYGSHGKFAQEQQNSYTTMIQQSEGFVSAMSAIYAQYSAVLAGAASAAGSLYSEGGPAGRGASAPLGTFGEGANAGGYGPSAPAQGSTHPHFAAGGMALAASATDVTFGEAGPELAMFLPLNSAGSPSAGGIGGGGLTGGAGGFVTIALQLSQDMEARIVSTTLTHAALQIERVYGGR